MTDQELLAQYLASRDEPSFTALVRRYLPLVAAAARRQVREPAMAADVTQAVFILLAKKAPGLSPQKSLAGWLLAATHYCARDALKQAQRRAHHERAAAAMRPEAAPPAEPRWDDLSPMLDAALVRLSPADRSAIALRFLENHTLEDVGRSLGLSKDAANKRIARALERLRKLLTRRGIVLPTAGLAAMLAAHPADAAVAHLSLNVATAALHTTLAAQTPAALIAKGAIHVMTLLKIKLALATAAAAIVILTTTTAVIVTVNAQTPPPPPPADSAPAAQPALSAKAAALAKLLRANVNSFTLALSYAGHQPQDKPFYDVFLSVPPLIWFQNPASRLGVVIDADTADKTIDFLAASGFLDRAAQGPADQLQLTPQGPVYLAVVRCGNISLQFDLGWNLSTLAWIDGLETAIPQESPAIPRLQKLLDRMADLGKEWRKSQPAAQAAETRLRLDDPAHPRVTLPSGVTVEILGLIALAPDAKTWWAADGSPLPKPPDFITDPPHTPLINDPQWPMHNPLVILVQLTYPSKSEPSFQMKMTAEGPWINTMFMPQAGRTQQYRSMDFPADLAATTLRINLATGIWHRLILTDGHGGSSLTVGPSDRAPEAGPGPEPVQLLPGPLDITVSSAMEADGFLALVATDNYPGPVARRFIATDLAGHNHEPGFPTNMNSGSLHTYEVTFRDLRKSQLKQFHYDLRPYDQWLEFRNVSLKPGTLTKPEAVSNTP